jgi:hypothetical protein
MPSAFGEEGDIFSIFCCTGGFLFVFSNVIFTAILTGCYLPLPNAACDATPAPAVSGRRFLFFVQEVVHFVLNNIVFISLL